jgi:hypothetical protein
MSNPFDADQDKAFDALVLVWGDVYTFDTVDDAWIAHLIGAPEGEDITGSNPDDISRQVREDWARRNPQPPHGPEGMPPS